MGVRKPVHAQARVRTRVEKSSGNVFRDLGFKNPEEELAKADLVILIERRIEELGLTQAEAAHHLGSTQPKVSKIVRGGTSGVSMDWLVSALVKLGSDVEIRVKPRNGKSGRLSVFAC
jgi:predicted XRE-type DNA-binding protein